MENFYNTDVFSIDKLEFVKYAFILIASKRRSGKSVVVSNIVKNLLNNHTINHIVLISNTADITSDYDFIDKKNTYNYDKADEIIDSIIKYQHAKKIKNKEDCPNILIILDDITIHKKSKKLIDLATMGRHHSIYVILSCQYPKMVVSTAIRNNLDNILFNDLNKIAEQALYECMHIPFKYNDLHKFVDDNNNNYQFIMYDNSANKKERLKIIKADMIKLKIEN